MQFPKIYLSLVNNCRISATLLKNIKIYQCKIIISCHYNRIIFHNRIMLQKTEDYRDFSLNETHRRSENSVLLWLQFCRSYSPNIWLICKSSLSSLVLFFIICLFLQTILKLYDLSVLFIFLLTINLTVTLYLSFVKRYTKMRGISKKKTRMLEFQ